MPEPDAQPSYPPAQGMPLGGAASSAVPPRPAGHGLPNQPSIDGAVRYDLAGNPIPSGSPPPSAAPGMPAQPGAWPPPPAAGNPYANPYGMPAAGNSSGEGGAVPPEVAAYKWNWGAFGLTWLWCLNHRMVGWGLLIFFGTMLAGILPGGGVIVSLAAGIYFAIQGHKLAWQKRRFASMSDYLAVQTAWRNWAIGVMIIGFLFGILGAILFPVFTQARLKAQMMSHGAGGYSIPSGNGSGSGSPGGGSAGGGR